MTIGPEELPPTTPDGRSSHAAQVLGRLQEEAIAAAKAVGHTTSVVDELLTDRRAEAARD